MPNPSGSYTVSAALLERDDMRAALRARDFRIAFRLMKKYDGASQDRIASPVEGLTQGRVSRIVNGQDHIASLDLVGRIADALRIPGTLLGLAPRPWERHPAPGGRATRAELRGTAGLVPVARRDTAATGGTHPAPPPGAPSPPGAVLVVEHDDAELRYDGRFYHATMRRQLSNAGSQPATRYLVRISVDRYPGDPERSNRLYRTNPLTWEELEFTARRGEDRMAWKVKDGRGAVKEVWLLFENECGRFPLYPGESAWIEYGYRVGDDKWGQWFQRAVRMPTRHLSVRLVFPTAYDPVVWGMETSMTAEAFPFRTAIGRRTHGDTEEFSWSIDNPPPHTRYRLEWSFRSPAGRGHDDRPDSPSRRMVALGIVQQGGEILRQVARPFDLPAEAEDARRVVAELTSARERVAAVHTFGKGMGIAAPQIGVNRAAAVVRTADGETLTLLTPRVVEESPDTDEQYEGCLSFFDVRGLVPRPLSLHVEHTGIDGERRITVFERGLARLVAHEVDHLSGRLYTDRVRPGVLPIPVSQDRGIGTAWTYRGP